MKTNVYLKTFRKYIYKMKKQAISRIVLAVAVPFFGACGEKPDSSPQLKNADQQSAAAVQYYETTLQEGIDFRKEGIPTLLTSISGFSGREEWGRWTDQNISKIAAINFKDALPQKFQLEIQANSIGSNVGVPIGVKIGSSVQYIKLKNWPDSSVYKLKFEIEKGIKVIEIDAPTYYQPKEVESNNNDARKLGIGVISLKIN